MKSTISTKVKEEIEITYPCLRAGKNTGNIYLFTDKVSCVTLWNGNSDSQFIGGASKLSVKETDNFHGSVTLSN